MNEPVNGKLSEALAKAQSEMRNAPLNKVNPHFKSKYADLAAVRDATMPSLAKNGISLTQRTVMRDGALVLVTRLSHISGEYLESDYPLPMAVDKPQIMGSAITYARRYCWASLCGISADEDDDAEGAERGNGHTKGNGNGKSYITAEQKEKIIGLLKETGSDTAKFLEYMGVATVDELPASLYARAIAALEKKLAA